MENKSKELQTAIEAAKKGAKTALKYFDKDIEVELKEDDTPVTIADRESEETIKSYILSQYPHAKFMGEETGGDIHEKEFWIIDPVDGTRSFARGIPTWCVIVSFAKDKEIVATAIYYPYNDIVYYAEKGSGAFKNDKRISVSHVADIKNAYMGYGSPKHFENKQVVIDLINAVASSRSWEATFSGCMVAEGKMDGTVDSYGKIWDLAPFKLLIEEAGGKITRMNGDEWAFEGYGAVLSNGKIHDQVIAILNQK